jgi:hypothetical protein
MVRILAAHSAVQQFAEVALRAPAPIEANEHVSHAQAVRLNIAKPAKQRAAQ